MNLVAIYLFIDPVGSQQLLSVTRHLTVVMPHWYS